MNLKDKLIITKLESNDCAPLELLLLADPSEKLIQKHLKTGEVYICTIDNQTIGVYVLISTKPKIIEIVNIAVDENFRRRGIGKSLIAHAKTIARKMGAEILEIGTGNSSLSQLGLYQKCGFRIVGIDKDFFKRNYEDKIIENGIECVDMIRLSHNL